MKGICVHGTGEKRKAISSNKSQREHPLRRGGRIPEGEVA